MPDVSAARWYLVQTKPRQESRALEHLHRQAFECFCPVVPASAGGHPARRVRACEPLFPGYLFIRLDCVQDNWYPIRSTRGVSRIVSFGGQPVPVQDRLLAELRLRLAHEMPQRPLGIAPGDRVRLTHDTLNAIEAIFLCPDGERRSVILLELMQRKHCISVSNHLIASYA